MIALDVQYRQIDIIGEHCVLAACAGRTGEAAEEINRTYADGDDSPRLHCHFH